MEAGKKRRRPPPKKAARRSSKKKKDDDDYEDEDEAELSLEEREEEYQPSPPKKKSRGGGKKKTPSATLSRLKMPGSFHVSGELLWGHIQTLIEGSETSMHDSLVGPVSTATGGTIIQHDYRYRAAARPGTWIVESAFIDDYLIGYVIHHQDVSGTDLLKRAAKIGISGNNHPDRNIVYVNRYDWSYHQGELHDVCKAMSDEIGDSGDENNSSDEENEELATLMGGRLMLIDPQHFEAFKSLVRRNPGRLQGNLAFRAGAGDPFGVHVECDDTEYELGWLCFNGQKHEQFKDSDELVGIVYDGAYSALGVEKGSVLKLEEEEVILQDANDPKDD